MLKMMMTGDLGLGEGSDFIMEQVYVWLPRGVMGEDQLLVLGKRS